MIARLAVALLVATTAVAAPRFERRIEVRESGPQRLDPDLDLVARSAPGLADLRIYDSGGREVPYLLVKPEAGEAEWLRARRFLIAPTKTSSGIEADAGQRREIDAIRLEGVSAPFLKRVRVEGSGDRHRWTLLADATVFNLPAQKLAHDVIEFAPVEVRYVRLTFDDSSSVRISGAPRVSLRLHGSATPPRPLRSDVPIHIRRSEPGKSRYRITLPAAGVPVTAVRLTIPSGDVFREVTISEPRLGGAEIVPITLGRGTIRQAERDGIIAADPWVAISRPASDELDVVIDDGSNPALTISSATLELTPQPWIYFEAATPGTYTARYGDMQATAARYDLEAIRPLVSRARATASWAGAKTIAVGAQVQIPLPTHGAKLDRSEYSIARPLAVSKPGMAILPLDADVVAGSRELADVRIVDEMDRQVPFIVEQRNEPLLVDLIVPKRIEEDGESVYRIQMPYASLPSGSRLVITTSAGVLERRVALTDHLDEARDRRVIASAVWRHADSDRQAPPLTMNLPRRVARTIELRIDEGDNAPLPITSARLVFPSFALRFVHPGTPLTLLYGNASARAPRYDLALIAARLFREPAAEIGFGGRTVTRATMLSGERRFFWIAIAAVVLALLVVLGRILRGVPQSGP